MLRRLIEYATGRVSGYTPGSSVRALMTGAAVLGFAGVLWAHAVVVPGTTTTRAYETYTLRVPNEKVVPTTRIDITFPDEVFVMSFADVPGWTLEVRRDDTGRAVGAVWTGTLPPARFVELPFVGVNPPEPTTLVWNVDQVYAGAEGEEVVSWSGPADSEFPASRTVVEAPAGAGAAGSGPADGSGRDAGSGSAADTLALVAILVSAVALVVSIAGIRRRENHEAGHGGQPRMSDVSGRDATKDKL